MKRIALITGATSGFGKSIAKKFSENGYDVIITGRRCERLEALKKELPGKVLTQCFDVRKAAEVEKAITSLPEEWKEIDVLVNNAGLAAGLGPIQEGSLEDWDQMIDTNVKGLLYVTRAVAPIMVARGHGHIINIGSIAGKEVYANGNVYCATKHAVDAITKGTRIDLVKHGIKVTQIAPGAAETEFSLVRFKGNQELSDNVYKGFTPLRPDDIAEVAYYVTTLPAHVNINDMVIMPTAQANSGVFHKKL